MLQADRDMIKVIMNKYALYKHKRNIYAAKNKLELLMILYFILYFYSRGLL